MQDGRRLSVEEKKDHQPNKKQLRVLRKCSPCAAVNESQPYKFPLDSRFIEAAKKLSMEEVAFLYEDIIKPLDFYGY